MQTAEQWAQQWASHQAWSLKGMTEFIRAIQADARVPEQDPEIVKAVVREWVKASEK